MELTINGERLEVDVVAETTFNSRHTGRTLKRLTLRVAVRGDDAHESFLRLIARATQQGAEADEGAGTVRRWTVRNSSYSYSESDDPLAYHHTLEMDEEEELMPTRLVVDDLNLKPYTYEEEFDKDVLIITARVVPSEAEGRRLRELVVAKDYYPVVREGLGQEARAMRFGLVVWSRQEGTTKYLLTLVEKLYDEDAPQIHPGEPQVPNLVRLLSTALGVLDALLEALVTKGVLSEVERDAIRSEGDAQRDERRWAFLEVEDIDAMWGG